MNDSRSHREHHGEHGAPQRPVPTPGPDAAGPAMADPAAVRARMAQLLDEAERPGAADPAAAYETAHEVLLDALATVDRN